MRVTHPRALEGEPPQIAVDVDGEHVPVDEDGTFEVPDGSEGWLQRYAQANDVEADELLGETGEAGICGFVKDDGSECQRDAGWGRDSDTGRCSDHVED